MNNWCRDFDETLDDIRENLGWTEPPLVKEVCEELSGLNSSQGDDPISIIQSAVFKVFDFDFPVAAQNHRQELETKILKNYYFRQICCEDIEEWKLRLSNKLNLIMPYYNELYQSKAYLVNFMDDVDYSRTVSEDTARTGMENTRSKQDTETTVKADSLESDINTNKAKGKNVDRLSSTPQGHLEDIENNTYLTSADIQDSNNESQSVGSNARKSNAENTGTSTGSIDTVNTDNGKRNMVESVRGKMGTKSKAEMVMEYRKAIVNIDNEIVNRLSDLFLSTYSPWYGGKENYGG